MNLMNEFVTLFSCLFRTGWIMNEYCLLENAPAMKYQFFMICTWSAVLRLLLNFFLSFFWAFDSVLVRSNGEAMQSSYAYGSLRKHKQQHCSGSIGITVLHHRVAYYLLLRLSSAWLSSICSIFLWSLSWTSEHNLKSGTVYVWKILLLRMTLSSFMDWSVYQRYHTFCLYLNG